MPLWESCGDAGGTTRTLLETKWKRKGLEDLVIVNEFFELRLFY